MIYKAIHYQRKGRFHMSKCILCGANAVINIQDNASRTIYNCPNCSVFVISDIVANEVEAEKGKIAAFLASRKLSGSNDIVLISLENTLTEKNYVHMTVKQIVSEFPDSIARRVELSLRNLVNKSEYPGHEIKIESLRSAPLLYLEKVSFDSMSFALNCLEKKGFVTISHYGASSSFFPCGVVVTPEGWDMAVCSARSAAVRDEAFVSVTAGKDYTEDYLKAASHSCKICGYDTVDTMSVGSGAVINHSLMAGVRGSRFVICDLSEDDPYSYFIAGMAKAYNKTLILTCRAKDKKKLRLDLSNIGVLLWNESADLSALIGNAIRALVY